MEIKEFSLPVESTISVKELIGKMLVDKNEKKIGKIDDIRISPVKKTVEALQVNEDFFSEDHFIGKDYIDTIEEDRVKLNIIPANEFLYKDVYTSKGEKIGTVTDLHKIGPTNEVTSIVVEQGRKKDEIVVPEDNIKNVGRRITLKTDLSKNLNKPNNLFKHKEE